MEFDTLVYMEGPFSVHYTSLYIYRNIHRIIYRIAISTVT